MKQTRTGRVPRLLESELDFDATPGRAAIDGESAAAGRVLRHVGSPVQAPHLGDKALGVVVPVSPDGLAVRTRGLCSHLLRRISLAVAIGQCDPTIHRKIVAVLHEHVSSHREVRSLTPVAQLRRVSLGFASQQRLRIRLGAVGLVAEPDAAEVTPGSFLPLLGSPESLARS